MSGPKSGVEAGRPVETARATAAAAAVTAVLVVALVVKPFTSYPARPLPQGMYGAVETSKGEWLGKFALGRPGVL